MRHTLAAMAIAMVLWAVLLAGTATAATVTVSSTAPTVDGADMAHLTGATSSDKFWTDTTNHGQTFTTGGDSLLLSSFTFQSQNAALKTKTFSIRIGEVSGSTFTTIAIETGQQTVDNAADDYLTFTFDTPVELSPNTVYGVDVEMTGSTSGWSTGIPYLWFVNSNVFSSGQRYTRGDGDPTTISLQSNDRIFHIEMIKLDPIVLTNGVATVITDVSATFNGILEASATNADVYVHWGKTDGADNFGAWDDSAFVGTWSNVDSQDVSYTANTLDPSSTYYYTFRATNDATNVWAGPSPSFTTSVGATSPSAGLGGGAANESTGTATLRGELTAGVVAQAYICWGQTDGGTSGTGGWENVEFVGSVGEGVVFSNDISGAYYGIEYDYRVYVTNSAGTDWSAVTTFSTLPPAGGPAGGETAGADFLVDAGQDTDGDNYWEDLVGTSGLGLLLDTGNGVARASVSSGTGLTHAYGFTGGFFGGGTTGNPGGAKLVDAGTTTTRSFQEAPGDWSNNDVTMEIWFKPDNLTPTPANGQIIFEDGGGTGLGFFIDSNALILRKAPGGVLDDITYDLSTDPSGLLLGAPTAEFIQAVGTYDVSTGAMELFVNGTSVGTASPGGNDWSGGDGAAFATRGEANTGGAGNGDSSTESLDGQIALVRVYDNEILTPTQISANFDAVATTLPGFAIANDTAVNIGETTADLVGTLEAPGSVFEVTLYWSTTSNATAATWQSDPGALSQSAGTFTNVAGHSVTGSVGSLTSGTTYYYTMVASNEMTNIWASPNATFSAGGTPSVDNAGGATDVLVTTAMLHGELTAGGSADLYICWGDNIPGTPDSTGAWDTVESMGTVSERVPFSTNVTGLIPSTAYYYRCYASNTVDVAWSTVTNFTTMDLTNTITGTTGGDDAWNTAGNWSGNVVPFGVQAAVISAGLTAKVQSDSTPTYSGGLTFLSNAKLQVGWTTSYANSKNALGTGMITMHDGSQVISRAGLGTYTFNQPFYMAGNGLIWAGISTANHNTTKTLAGGISGPGKLTWNGVNGTWGIITTANPSWTGGFETADPQNQRHRFRVSANGGFGTGDVAINNNCSLYITSGLTDAIDDGAALTLNGVPSSDAGTKLVLDGSDTVNELWIDGVQKPANTYDNTESWVSGAGTLTVLTSPPGFYPYITGTVPADDTNNVVLGTKLVATFDRNIVIGGGDITITNLMDGTSAVIDVTDASQVLVAGAVLTIDQPYDLLASKNYAVLMDAGVVEDATNAVATFLGIADTANWNFTTITNADGWWDGSENNDLVNGLNWDAGGYPVGKNAKINSGIGAGLGPIIDASIPDSNEPSLVSIGLDGGSGQAKVTTGGIWRPGSGAGALQLGFNGGTGKLILDGDADVIANVFRLNGPSSIVDMSGNASLQCGDIGTFGAGSYITMAGGATLKLPGDQTSLVNNTDNSGQVRATDFATGFRVSAVYDGSTWTDFSVVGIPTVGNAGGPTGIGIGTATLNGQVVADGGAPLDHVRIYFGTSDGGENPASWDANYVFNPASVTVGVPFSTNLTGLLYGLEYSYRTYASNANGEAWADVSTFSPQSPGGGGEIAIYRESTAGEAIPQGAGSALECEWDTIVRGDGEAHTLQGDNKSIACAAGHHLAMYSAYLDRTASGNRSEALGQLRLAGADLPIGWSQCYTRWDNGNEEAILSGGGIIEAGADEPLLLRIFRTDDNGSGSLQRWPDASGIQLLKLDDTWDYCRLSLMSDQTGPIDANWVAVQYDSQEELDGGSFGHTSGSSDITLKAAGHYLVFANTHAFCSVDRTILKQRLLLDGTEIDGSRTTVYIRGNQNSCSEGAAAIGTIIEAAANQVLKVEGSLDVNRNPCTYKASMTAVSIAKLPDDGDYIRLDQSLDTFNFNPSSTQPVPWDTEDEKDDASFTHDNGVNNTRVTVDTDDDYLFLTALHDDNDEVQRGCYWQRWRTDGSTIHSYGHGGRYARNYQGADSVGNWSGIILGMNAGQYVEVVSEQLGNVGTLTADIKGLQGMRIGSLIPPAPGIANTVATHIGATSADLVGTLDAPQSVFDVAVYWSTSNNTESAAWLADGTASKTTVGTYTNVTGQSVTGQVSTLTSGTVYYYTMVASNAVTNIWASPNVGFGTLGAPAVDTVAGATGIDVGAATLNGQVVSDGGTTLDHVRIYFGDNDGGATHNWDEMHVFNSVTEGVPFSTNVTGLLYGVAYTYRTYASNSYGEAWSAPATFTTPAPEGPAAVGISYHPITGDGDSEITNTTTYTHAVDFGTDSPRAQINGVQFQAGGTTFGSIAGTSATIGTGTTTIPTAHGGNTSAAPYLNGALACDMEALVEDMNYNNVTGVITLTGLTPGQDYRFRLYNRQWGTTAGSGRGQDIGFDTDGVGSDISGAEHTAAFEADDASLPDPSFATFSQVYALTYDYALSPGVSTLTVYVNRMAGDSGTYHMYGLTNEELPPGAAPLAIANTAATNIKAATADLVGTLDATQSVFDVSVYWSTTSNANASAWLNDGTVSSAPVGTYTNVTGLSVTGLASSLSADTVYYYTMMATNAATNIWASPNAVFTSEKPPTLLALSPTNNATDISPNVNLVATFDENIALVDGGVITIRNLTDVSDTVITLPDGRVTVSGATNLAINPSVNLDGSDTYAVLVDGNAIADTIGNLYGGIGDTATWRFTVADPELVPPVISSLSPTNNATDMPVAGDLVATFDENVELIAGGIITIKNLTDASSTPITLPDGRVSVSGKDLTIDPSVNLDFGDTYAVRIDGNALEDVWGNNFGGINDDTTWRFDTEPLPAIASLSPTNNATGVEPSANLVATFNKSIALVDGGTITIKNLTDANSTTITLPDPGQVSVAGAVLTIDPSANLGIGDHYAIQIGATVIDDLNGNSFAGIGDDTTWNFTVREAITATYVGPNTSNNDRWNLTTSWDIATVPAAEMNAVIPAGKLATAWSASTPTYIGNLTIGTNATAGIGWTTGIPESYNALGTPGFTTIFMYDGSLINTRMGGSPSIPAILLLGNAKIRLGSSTQTPASAQFGQGISGAYTLTLESNAGAYNTTLSTSNSFSELIVNGLGGRGGNMWTLKATAAGSLGTGDVTVNHYLDKSPQLYVGADDVMADTAILSLNGAGPAGDGANMVSMNANDTVAKLVVNGVQQLYGTYGRAGHGGVDYEVSWMTGNGILTVPTPPSGYWDINGTTAGAGGATPAGLWNAANTYWNSTADGSGSVSAWPAGQPAIFAAGTDANGTYTVTVDGTNDMGGLVFEEGTVTLLGGELRLTADSAVNVAAGLTATVATPVTHDATAWQLSKSGDGTLVLSGDNGYAGVTKVEAGTLSVSSLADAGVDSDLGNYPAAGADGLVLAGGTLRYTGGATNVDRGFTLQGDCTLDVNTAGTALTLGASAGAGNSGTLTVTGGAGSGLALGELSVLTVSPTLNPTVGAMTVASIAGDTRYGNPAPTLTLGGTTAGNLVPGDVIRINRHPSGWDPGINVAKSGSGDWTISGAVNSGNAKVTVYDGTLTLSSASSSYSGQLAVRNGTLSVPMVNNADANGPLGRSTQKVILGNTGGQTGTLRHTGGTASSTKLFTMGTGGTGLLEVVGGSAELTLTGAIDGSGALSKTGPGTLILVGAKTYSGDTTIDNGTLRVNGSLAAGTVTVNTGGTLGGTGTVTTVSVQSGGVVAPGESTGTLTVGNNVTIAAGGVLAIEIDGSQTPAVDVLAVGGNLDITGATLNLTFSGAPPQAPYVIAMYGSLTGAFGAVNGLSAGGGIDYGYNGGTAIAVMPAPTLFIVK